MFGKLFLIAWLMFPLPALLIGPWVVGDRWTPETTTRLWLLLAAVALPVIVIWVGVLGFGFGFGFVSNPKVVPALLIFGCLLGLNVAGPAVTLLNGVGDSSPAQAVHVRLARDERTRIRFVVADGPQRGLPFACSNATWIRYQIANRTLLLRRGRLGLWWLDLPW